MRIFRCEVWDKDRTTTQTIMIVAIDMHEALKALGCETSLLALKEICELTYCKVIVA